MIPTIEWQDNHIRMIDQRRIPSKIQWYTCKGYRDVIKGIEKMVIRGAPAIGIAAAMGLALGAAAIKTVSYETFRRRFMEMADLMVSARPTAVNLRWAVERMSGLVESSAGRKVDVIKKISTGGIRKDSRRGYRYQQKNRQERPGPYNKKGEDPDPLQCRITRDRRLRNGPRCHPGGP